MYAFLLVENSHENAILSLVLQRCGIAVTASKDLGAVIRNWFERPSDLLMVALTEPDLIEQVGLVRGQTKVPLILITDPVTEQLQADLLDAGADLVVSRPFSALLLISQVLALIRRAEGTLVLNMPTLNLADLELDPVARVVEFQNRPSTRLTHLEFRLLYTLMINRGQVLPVDKIVEWVWGYNGQGDRELVRGLISRLRNKIETDPQKPHYIITVPGVGYLFHHDT